MRRLLFGLLLVLLVSPWISAENPSDTLSSKASGFSLSWYTIDGGGSSTGGSYRLDATAGQPDAGVATGGGYRLEGGFQPGSRPAAAIFSDGFESGSLGAWSAVVGAN